ncbi:MAG: acyltransferase [Hyphomicrobiales bacterium]|nr:acyltransferase [Hyphomicrobiales bacterium]
MRISEYARGRDNNFTLLRLLASLTVVLYHSGPALGVGLGREFLFDFVGRRFVEMALDMLFVTSGFLVTASLFNRGDLNHFLWARALRLYPALWLMLPLTVFLLAPALTTLPLADYFTARATWDYLVKGATIIGGIRYSLPGVFETLPLKGEFNGSLWTLPIEARMYVYLAAAWLAFSFTPKIRVKALSVTAPVAAAAMMAAVLLARTRGTTSNGDIAVFMFYYGASLYFWRDRLFLNLAIFAALPLLVLASAMLDRTLAFAVYLLCLPPFLLCLAYIPGGGIRAVNRWGDYSYGIYIYAFPLQQTLELFFPGLPVLAMAAASGAGAFGLAFCSWNLVERRAMGLKNACADATARGFCTFAARIKLALRAKRHPPAEGAGGAGPREAFSSV